MSYALYYDAPGNEQMYARVADLIGDEHPHGMVVHVVTKTGSGLRHLSVWESREDWLAFRDNRVRPAVTSALRDMGIPAPTGPPEEHALDLVDVATIP